jgi:hypothetical protein
MIGSSDFHAYGYSARRPVAARQRGQHHAMWALAPFQSTTVPTLLRKILVLAARLRRFLNGQVAAAIAHHEREAASIAQRKLDQPRLDKTRIYCGPLDQIVAAARQRKHAA